MKRQRQTALALATLAVAGGLVLVATTDAQAERLGCTSPTTRTLRHLIDSQLGHRH